MSDGRQTGRMVDGRFELLERLGSGGMGTVWRARDVGLHREVAIKEVRPADAAMVENNPALAAQQRERVLRESRALARLQHPNVVSIYQIIESPGSPYPWIVMELVRGTSLDGRLREGTLAPAEAARIGRDVLAALRAAHAAGILHRDVKPGNVLLRPDGSAVLTDFGIAALHDSTQLTATGELIGSPEYIAPERLRGDETKTASDFWSLAMLLYVAVEGYHPMRRATTMATLAAVMTEPVPPPRRSGSLGPALSAVLVHDPAARPTGEQLDHLLAAAEHGTPVPLGPPTPPGPAFPAAPSEPRYQQQLPPPPPTRTSDQSRVYAIAAIYSVSVVIVVGAVIFLLNSFLNQGNDPPNTGTDSPSTHVAGGTTTTTAAQEDLTTPAGARKVVGAMSAVMGGTQVSEFTLYPDSASATAPTAAVENGFDDFQYSDGVATRKGPNGVDDDRTVLDLNEVNWDALPALWDRASKELGVDAPTMRYVIVETSIVDDPPEMKVYLVNDYGAGYISADLAGNVTRVVPLG